MKIFKKTLLIILVIIILTAVGGYIYFEQKFTPERNYLKVENESGPTPFTWLGLEKNALLLPVHFDGDSTTYYLQFDTGSPYTVFYSSGIKNISQVSVGQNVAKTSFFVGKTKISSDQFKIYDQGAKNEDQTLKIIGTIGSDILEDRKTVINFKENNIKINLSKAPDHFQNHLFDFKFKKKKIIFKGLLKGEEEKFLFDSGTSAYELLTNKEVWEDLKLPSAKVTIEKSRSWDKILMAYSANCDQKIQISNQEIPLKTVTYVEGISKVQYSMMKYSGMTGMLGNKIFLNSELFIDCINNKMGIK